MVLYIHLWSVNIILLMFIIGAIGYILNEDTQKYIISTTLLKYLSYIFSIALTSGIFMLFMNSYWISFPKFLMKLLVIIILLGVLIHFRKTVEFHNNIRSAIIIVIFLIIYSISLLIGAYY